MKIDSTFINQGAQGQETESGTGQAVAAPAHDIVVVDTAVNGYETLLAGVAPDTEVILIGSGGLGDLVAALEGRTDIDSLQILSHGNVGSFRLGPDEINASTLADHADALMRIGAALGEDGDILLYGCRVAEGGDGLEFIQMLADVTGADVAASDDLTGSATRGGDWELEASVGEIETVAVSAEDMDGFQSLLATPSVGITSFSVGASITSSISSNPSITDVDSTGFDAEVLVTGGVAQVQMDDGGSFGEAVSEEHDGTLQFHTPSTTLSYVSIRSNDGAEFQLDQFEFGATLSITSTTFTFTGYRNGSSVSGASVTYDTTNNTTGDAQDGNGTVSFGSDWENIDEIRITAADSSYIDVVAVDDIVVSASVANSAPVITVASEPTVGEDENDISVSTFSIADGDTDDQEVTITVTGGTISIGTGSLSFTDGDGSDDSSMTFSGSLSAVNTALAAMTFTPTADLSGTNAASIQVVTDDGSGDTDDETLTFDITGAADAPSFGGDLTGSLNEDTDTFGGTATVTDADAGESTFNVDTVNGSYGDLTIAANGDWVYDLDEANSDVQALASGDTLGDTLTVSSADGTAQNITITINGVNDAATFGGTLSNSLNEDTDTVGGTATVTDADTGEGTFNVDTVNGSYG
ncbi:DUF4347 domain-containing protein, partial [Kordiimonas aestuarii]|uniref:DUF4347 domain-containing protein n=1 Tax=Kordiimonas aestuarii TaxID=1005925 RepID=UPI0021CF4D8E